MRTCLEQGKQSSDLSPCVDHHLVCLDYPKIQTRLETLEVQERNIRLPTCHFVFTPSSIAIFYFVDTMTGFTPNIVSPLFCQ